MKTLLSISALVLTTLAAHAGPVTVTNVTAAQWPASPIVEIFYDLLNPSGGMHVVTVEVSTNGGADYTLPCTHFSGAVGAQVTTGVHRSIEWYAEDDLPCVTVSAARVRVTATDGVADTNGMVCIPAGSFDMGDTFNEGWSDELPVHSVYISAFYMYQYEVSNQKIRDVLQWAYDQGKLYVSIWTVKNDEGDQQELLDLNGADCQISWNGSSFVVDAGKQDYPCVDVTWYGAMAYCKYKNEIEGKQQTIDLSNWTIDWNKSGYRLPTEAEWEKAARGGQGGHRFPWHDVDWISHARANYDSYWVGGSPFYSYDHATSEGFHPDWNTGTEPYTSPVETFPASAFGLHDMVGNVWEWCWDRYSDGYYDVSPGSDPRGSASGSGRVVRGGSWYYNAYRCRVADRSDHSPVFNNGQIGFRVCVPAGE